MRKRHCGPGPGRRNKGRASCGKSAGAHPRKAARRRVPHRPGHRTECGEERFRARFRSPFPVAEESRRRNEIETGERKGGGKISPLGVGIGIGIESLGNSRVHGLANRNRSQPRRRWEHRKNRTLTMRVQTTRNSLRLTLIVRLDRDWDTATLGLAPAEYVKDTSGAAWLMRKEQLPGPFRHRERKRHPGRSASSPCPLATHEPGWPREPRLRAAPGWARGPGAGSSGLESVAGFSSLVLPIPCPLPTPRGIAGCDPNRSSGRFCNLPRNPFSGAENPPVGVIRRGFALGTFQELLGHNDVKTTLIFTRILNRGGRGVKSPVDTLCGKIGETVDKSFVAE